jgi:hypothetical protein
VAAHTQARGAAQVPPGDGLSGLSAHSPMGWPRKFGDASYGVDGLLIADDMFRLVHDDRGKPRVHPDVIALGLASALLAELILLRHAWVDGDRVLVNPAPKMPHDRVAQTVLLRLREEPRPLTVRDWLAFLARSSYYEVASRMVEAGHVVPIRRLPLIRNATRYIPVDINEAFWPKARLAMHLEYHDPLDELDTILGGLVVAADLYRSALTCSVGDGVAQLRSAVAAAPPSIQSLILHTEAAIGDAIIDGRRRRG